MVRLAIKAAVGALLGFAVVVGIGLMSGRLQNGSEWMPWLWNELDTNPQTTIAVVIIVGVIFLWYTRKKKDDE